MKLTVSNVSGKRLSLLKTTLESGASLTMYVPDEVYLGQDIFSDVVEKMIWDDISAFEDAGLVTITAVPQEGSGELALANGKMYLGNASGVAIERAVSGDVTISNTGVVAIGAKKVVHTMVAAAAGTVLVGTKTSGDVTALDISVEGALAIGQGAGETAVAHALSGDVTMTSGGVTAIGADKVTYAQMQNVGIESVVANPTGVAANPTDVALAEGQVMARATGGHVSGQTVKKEMIAGYNVDYTKIGIANGKVLVGDVSGHATEQALGADATLMTTKVTLTAAQIKALGTAAIEIVPTPGANKVAEAITSLLRYNYGSEVLVVAADSDLEFRHVNASGVICSQPIETTGFLDQTAVMITNGRQKINIIGTVAQLVNTNIVLHNSGTAITGNASNDCTLDVWVHYRVYTVA